MGGIMTMTMTEIKTEVLPTLTLEEKFDLAEALDLGFDAWDLQMREDCKPGGKLDQLCKKALEEHRRGETLPGWP